MCFLKPLFLCHFPFIKTPYTYPFLRKYLKFFMIIDRLKIYIYGYRKCTDNYGNWDKKLN